MVDVTAIGAGGGSDRLARRRRLACGSVRTPPAPSPAPPATAAAATRPTVTDASVVLGYIDPPNFAGGTLHAAARTLARQAIERNVARPLGIDRGAGGARHPPRAERADGGGDPAGLDRPRHRSARLCPAAAGRRRPDARQRAGRGPWHHRHRRAGPSRRAVRRRAARRAGRARGRRRLSLSAGRARPSTPCASHSPRSTRKRRA